MEWAVDAVCIELDIEWCLGRGRWSGVEVKLWGWNIGRV